MKRLIFVLFITSGFSLSSIAGTTARIAAWKPERLAITHFGMSEDVDGQLRELGTRLDDWAMLARNHTEEDFIASVQAQIRREGGDELATRYQ